MDIPVLNKIIIKHIKKLNKFSIDLVIRQIIREIINEMVKDLIATTKKNIKDFKLKKISDVSKAQYPVVVFSIK